MRRIPLHKSKQAFRPLRQNTGVQTGWLEHQLSHKSTFHWPIFNHNKDYDHLHYSPQMRRQLKQVTHYFTQGSCHLSMIILSLKHTLHWNLMITITGTIALNNQQMTLDRRYTCPPPHHLNLFSMHSLVVVPHIVPVSGR